jgi:hypothetical protein
LQVGTPTVPAFLKSKKYDTYILTHPQWEKPSTGVESQQQANNRKEYKRARKTCRFVITVWAKTAKDEEQIYEEKPVSELKVGGLLLLLHFYICM